MCVCICECHSIYTACEKKSVFENFHNTDTKLVFVNKQKNCPLHKMLAVSKIFSDTALFLIYQFVRYIFVVAMHERQ